AYWITNQGYHLINYDQTLGYDKLTFGYGIPYYEIVLKFIFWFIIFVSGLGLIKTNKLGLQLGLIGISISGLICLTYASVVTSKRLNHSRTLLINQTEREMTISEKWEYIYLQPTKYWALFGLILTILTLIRLRQIKAKSIG
ncbi:MAG: hypothetical protein AAF632_21305, partial [Bacteroidota bacterium]